MFPFHSNCGFGRGEGLLLEGIRSVEMDAGGSTIGSRSSTAACKTSHSEAERRRRERINGHLATLRTLLPNTAKTDKASLLAEVVQHVRDLKRHAADVASNCTSSRSSDVWAFFPGETDEVTLAYDPDPRSPFITASVCCEDRPDLLSELNGAIRSLRLRAVRAEIATVGGRTKGVFLIEGGGGGDEEISAIRRVLKAVLEMRAAADHVAMTSTSASGAMLPGNKRPRLGRQLSTGRV
ncbi:hypothetical protein ACLOJK_013584 [Asimina triloba]